MTFREELALQRWDDHRYYHHSTINQSLHLFSALCFLASYALLFKSPEWSVFLGWIVAMWARQIGHFFFEPKGYDDVNEATHEHKEAIKVGYNLRRKVVLLIVWAAIPVYLLLQPSFFGLLGAPNDIGGFFSNLAYVWLALAAVGLVFRVVQLFFSSGVQSGLVWLTKILTDPFHDVKLYHKAPLHVIRGEKIVAPEIGSKRLLAR